MGFKPFGIDPAGRQTVGDAKRRTGFVAEDIDYHDLNELLFKQHYDHVIGTNSQLVAGDCACKYQSSDQTLRDADGTEVTLSDGDRVYIIGLDTLTADFDLSAYDRLNVISDPSIELANGSWGLVFGDDCYVDINAVTDDITSGSGLNGVINRLQIQCARYSEANGDFTITGTNWTTVTAVATLSRTQSGKWWVSFNIRGSVSSSVTSLTLTFSGITFVNNQSIGWAPYLSIAGMYCSRCTTLNDNTVVANISVATNQHSFFGNVELVSKPTWAN